MFHVRERYKIYLNKKSLILKVHFIRCINEMFGLIDQFSLEILLEIGPGQVKYG